MLYNLSIIGPKEEAIKAAEAKGIKNIRCSNYYKEMNYTSMMVFTEENILRKWIKESVKTSYPNGTLFFY